MPSFFHHLVPLDPPPQEQDRLQICCLQQIPFHTKSGHTLQVGLLGRPHTVDAIAVSFPNDTPKEPRSGWIEKITNHMIATLRITCDQHADVIRNGDGFLSFCYEGESSKPEYHLLISSFIRLEHRINVSNIMGTFSETLTHERASIISLLAEAQFPPLPAHYKVLSLIRCLELLAPDEKVRYTWLSGYNLDFELLGISERKLPNALHELRTRCAHGQSRGGAAPFVSPAFSEQANMSKLVHLLRTIVVEKTGHEFDLKFVLDNRINSFEAGRSEPTL